jgi:hypothetical protein
MAIERKDAITRAARRATGPDGKIDLSKFYALDERERARDLQHEDDLRRAAAIRTASRQADNPPLYVAIYLNAMHLKSGE